jgi:hypothetical protein
MKHNKQNLDAIIDAAAREIRDEQIDESSSCGSLRTGATFRRTWKATCIGQRSTPLSTCSGVALAPIPSL